VGAGLRFSGAKSVPQELTEYKPGGFIDGGTRLHDASSYNV
jgi:hypothetical protein